MAINPPSDIVLDVLNAADPARAEAAAQRLNALGAANGNGDDFAKALDSTASSTTPDLTGVASAANARARLTKKELFASQKTHNAEVGFEASILGNFMSEILPKDSPDIYGQGEAGDIWRSMLGDQIAHQIAQSGRLGIAKRLFETHLLPHDAAHASLGPIGGAANVAQASANLLSAASGSEYANGAVLFASRKRS